jgi:Abnormal spindle-like microcephaly-assoc'd, ASPM-SPD-2-Hydin
MSELLKKRALHALRNVLLLAPLLLTACPAPVTTSEACALACAGCCDLSGTCQPGTTELACGSAGRVCSACAAGLTCQTGTCQSVSQGGGGGGQPTPNVTFPATVDFGAVRTGQSAHSQLVLTNDGDGSDTVVLSFLRPVYTVDTTGPLTVPARGSVMVGLTFTPTAAGAFDDVLSVKRPDGTSLGNVFITGIGGGAEATATPTSLAFGVVGIRAGASRTVGLGNTGQAVNLVLGTPQYEFRPLNGTTLASDFVLDLINLPAGGVPPGATAPLKVSIASTATAGVKSAQLALFSNDSASPLLIPISADVIDDTGCVLAPGAALDFGTLGEGMTRTLSVQLSNSGSTACVVSSALEVPLDPTCSTRNCPTNRPCAFGSCQLPSGFSIANATTVVVDPLVSAALPVTFTAPILNGYGAAMTATLRLGGTQARQVQLSSKVIRDCLSLQDQVIDFGMVATGCNSGAKTLSVFNSCILGVQLQGFSTSSKFSATGPANGTVVNGNTGVTFSLRYTPTVASASPDEGTLAVQAVQGGGANVTYGVKLIGRATASATLTDTFVVPPRKTDLLVVIDDSCSMADKQSSLAGEVPTLVNAAISEQVDFHVGVVGATTDSLNGNLLQPFFTNVTPNLSQALAAALQPGTSGGSIESCTDAAMAVLGTPGQLGRRFDGVNAGFLRDDARLSIVCVTDAPDQSSTFTQQLTSLTSIKGRSAPHRLTYSVVAPLLMSPPGSCIYDAPLPNMDTSNQSAATALGGISEEICTNAWPAVVTRIAQRAFAEDGRRFTLLRVPTNTPVVSVGGVPSAFSSASVNGATEVRLNTPAPVGSTVSVSYAAACN